MKDFMVIDLKKLMKVNGMSNDKSMSKHLRGVINHYWRPLVKKDSCEKCGSIEKLEVHHIDSFKSFMNKYNIPESKNGLSNEEILKYEYLCIGYHFKTVKTITLCEKCHKEKHKSLTSRINGTCEKIDKNFNPSLFIENERDRYLVWFYANTSLRLSSIVKLKKKDLYTADIPNKEYLFSWIENKKDNSYLFPSRVGGGNRAISHRRAQQIISKYIKGE